jgi:hypothetical protein
MELFSYELSPMLLGIGALQSSRPMDITECREGIFDRQVAIRLELNRLDLLSSN